MRWLRGTSRHERRPARMPSRTRGPSPRSLRAQRPQRICRTFGNSQPKPGRFLTRGLWRRNQKLPAEQSTISMLESGQRRIEVIEFMALADVLNFDPVDVIRQLRATKIAL